MAPHLCGEMNYLMSVKRMARIVKSDPLQVTGGESNVQVTPPSTVESTVAFFPTANAVSARNM
jgi:hypothetical protein